MHYPPSGHSYPLKSYPYYSYPSYTYPHYLSMYTPISVQLTRNHQLNDAQTQQVFIHEKDHGPKPFVVNIAEVTRQNNTYRTALWTGREFQVTVMSINVGEDIGLEVHPTTDQFIRIEEGQGLVQMGDSKDQLDFVEIAYKDYAIMIPAGKWHNLTNTGNKPLKVYVIYAPPEHPYGTVHETKAIAMSSE
jgi:mannose-6-phosphate isomerase-like protein (cupin superfamily)